MSDWGWQVAGIFALGVMLVGFGVLALILDVVRRFREHKRQMRKERGRFTVMQDLKDL
jgi:uncharacterized membrane protein YidH (DUF202 family)